MATSLRNSLVIFRDALRFATLTFSSSNRKTGRMAQLQILARGSDPVQAVNSGADEAVCGDCPLRKQQATGKRVCYVNLAWAPLAIYRAVVGHPVTGLAKVIRRLGNRPVRFGSYGDPAFLPLDLLSALAQGRRHTGYTHQWRTVSRRYAAHLMASVESLADRAKAKALGYRTFRVVSDVSEIANGEILCPNYTHGTQCADCGLCMGAGTAKDIVILAHGNGAGYLQPVEAVASA